MKANEFLRTIIFATLLLMPFAAYAQDGEDVTSLYIINAGFDEDLTFQADGTKKAAINTETSLSDRSWAYITEDSTVYARPKDSSSQQRPDGRKAEAVNGFIGWIKGWKPITNQDYPMCEWIYYGAVPYSIGADAVPLSDDSNTFLTAPDKLSAYSTEDNIGALYLRSGWGNQCNYQQTTTLPKGSYQLEYWTININSSSSAEAEDITNVSFKDESTEVVFKDDSGTAFSSHEWVKHSISFSLKEATECTLTFGFKAANAGSNANPWICIDGVKLIATDSSSTTPEIITFADAKVKEICVANWDTDGDGELSYDEAAAVTSLGEVFQSNGSIYTFDELKHFTGLTTIDAWAFSYCYNLNVVTFPPTITSIGDYAFTCCYRIYSLTFPEGLISIGAFAFESIYYNLTSITIPSSVTTIGEKAFQECREVTSVTVYNPTPISINDNDVFYATSNNATLYVPKGSKQAYMEADGWRQFAKIEEIADSTMINFADAKVKEICVANWDTDGDGELSYDEAASVTDIGTLFKDNSSIEFFDELQYFTGLTSIGDSAFYSCDFMRSITIPKNVTSIGEVAFWSCRDLRSINVSEENLYFDSRNGCNAIIRKEDTALIKGCQNTIIPEGVTSIGAYAFDNCIGLHTIDIPNGVNSIGEFAFESCSYLTSITIPESVTKIGEAAFISCYSLSSITIPEGVTTIESSTFDACIGLSSIQLPNSLTTIGFGAFVDCRALTSITIPESVTSIGQNAFEFCINLTSITIPVNIVNIGYYAFQDCIKLLAVNWESSIPLKTNAYFGLMPEFIDEASSLANRLYYINSNAEVIDNEGDIIFLRPNIIRGGQIENISFIDNQPLYIPEPFTAQHISYTHYFSKETQRGVASGWESLVLPFDVQSISCDSVEIVPFGANAVGYNKFWLAEVNPETGFTAATSIKANKPYILAMPNSTEYGSGNITGSVTFSATNVTVQPTSNEKTECAAFALTPCWSHINDTDSTYNEIYVLNDSTYTAPNQTVYPAGSVFVRSLRPVRPFEAYYTPANGAGVKEFFPISEMENGIRPTPNPSREGRGEASAVYDLSGRRRSLSPSPSPVREGRAGVYIKDGRKIMVK